jgi:hypothetical protein
MMTSASTPPGYAIPILALVALFIFNQADITRVDYLILGATAVVVANMLINFEAEARRSFEALILALGVCGTLAYSRVDIFEWLGVPGWTWSGDGYFGSVALGATVFTLLLAFRVARLVTVPSTRKTARSAFCENWTSW